MIKLISWRYAVVGFALPWLGFAFGCLSKLKQERKDIIAIAIETGIQTQGCPSSCCGSPGPPGRDLAAVVLLAVATLSLPSRAPQREVLPVAPREAAGRHGEGDLGVPRQTD